MRQVEGKLSGEGLRIALVVSRFNGLVVEPLVHGAGEALRRAGCRDEDIVLYRVPGAFEISPMARRVAESGLYDAVVCLGAVIRGETPHFEYVAGTAAQGVAQVALEVDLPITFGILTTDTLEQALERAGGKAGNKGTDAALAAVEMVHVYRALRATKPSVVNNPLTEVRPKRGA